MTVHNWCIVRAKHFSTCGSRFTSGPYTAILSASTPQSAARARRGRFPAVLQSFNLSQESRIKKIRKSIPDELWAIIILGIGGVCLFIATEFNKMMYGKNKPPELEYKLKMAKKKDIDGEKEKSIKLLKEALKMLHDYFERMKNNTTEENEEEKKDKIKMQKYLRYVLDQLANLSFDLQKWSEAEHYFRLLLRDLLSAETPKNDDSVVEVSVKLSIACAHQDKHDLAVQGFQWATEMVQKKVNESSDATENSKALLGVCLESWGTYLLSQDKPMEAATLLARALKVSKDVLGQDHEQTTVILNNLAKAYAESGRYELAEEMAREAVRIAEKTNSTHLSRFMANLGAILNLEGNVLKAKEALKKALKLADETKDEETKEVIRNSLTEMDA